MSRLTIYTDGSCSPNPGKGGWGFISIEEKHELHVSGGKEYTTNNVMEMTAVIQALKMYKKHSKFLIISDSQYVINCAQGKWQRKKNCDLWKKYDKYAVNKDIEWKWVKGHSGDKYNELVDKLAKSESEKKNKKILT
jgi:ribonuclease HI